MSITIEVTVQCQATTYKGTKCTREATVYEGPTEDNGEVPLVAVVEEHKKWTEHLGGKYYTTRDNVVGFHHSHGFHCNTHTRSARNARADQSRTYSAYRSLTSS